MPFTGCHIQIDPIEDTFSRTIAGIEHQAIDIVPCYAELYTAFRRIEEKRFGAEGPGWKQLADSTVKGRERLGIGGSHPILNRTGASYEGRTGGQLRRSLTTKGAKNAVITPQVDGVFVGTKDPIAAYHQDGTDKMSARPLVDLNQADAEVFGAIVGKWLYGHQVGGSSLGNAASFVPAVGI